MLPDEALVRAVGGGRVARTLPLPAGARQGLGVALDSFEGSYY